MMDYVEAVNSDINSYQMLIVHIITTALEDVRSRGKKTYKQRSEVKHKVDAMRFFFDGRVDYLIGVAGLDINADRVREQVAREIGTDVESADKRIDEIERLLMEAHERVNK